MSGVSAATIIAGASAVASIASAGMSIIGGMNASAATSSSNAANMAVANENARLAKDMAEADAQDIALSTRKSLASVRANAGASGLLVEDGSPLEVAIDVAGTGELNRQRRLWQGNLDARNAQLQGYQSQRADSSMGYYERGGASLLTGVSKVRDLLDTKTSTPAAGGVGGVGGG